MLEVSNLCKRFGGKTVADHISLTVGNGEILAVLGASGSGKSTLLNMVAGLTEPDSGRIRIDGICQNGIEPERRQVAMMFQDFALLPHLNVWQNAAFGLRMRGVGKAAAKQAALAVLAELGLETLALRHVGKLSGGEQQRVALARALVVEPKVLLLDEPFSGLDTARRSRLQMQTRDLAAKRGVPTVLVTHDAAEACLMADQIALLADGCVIQIGTPEQLLQRPVCAQAARLLGCLNVSASHYIPPSALSLHDQHGALCRIAAVCRQPSGWRLILLHPHYGELVWLGTQLAGVAAGGVCRVGIDEAQVVFF